MRTATAMRLHFLGTTGYHPNGRRQTACLMLPEVGVILDAGTGIFAARDLIQTESLLILLTHAHLDHSIGLTYIFDVLHEKQVNSTVVYGEAAKLAAIREHLFHQLLFPVLPPMEFRALEAGKPVALPDGGRLTAFDLEHPGGSYGFRLDWPKHSMAYITDTTADVAASYVDKIANVDLLVHECYFPDGHEQRAKLTGHSCLTPVAQVARRAHAKQLALVHTNPLDIDGDTLNLIGARKIFPRISIPDDGDVMDF
jgi:ribonuclease BN (tRNA processing enzyme)